MILSYDVASHCRLQHAVVPIPGCKSALEASPAALRLLRLLLLRLHWLLLWRRLLLLRRLMLLLLLMLLWML